MIFRDKEGLLTSVWEDSFEDKSTKEKVVYWRASVQVPGEAPQEYKVAKEDYQALFEKMGKMGKVVIDVDCRPGRKQKVYLKDVEG